MKEKELDLSKVHVDHFKSSQDASWDGLKLAYTKAGWATVTKDGTIIEVLDAFSGAKHSAEFEARNELPTTNVIDESDLLNYKMIGSAGVLGDAQFSDSVINTVLTSIIALSSAGYTINIAGTSPDVTGDLELSNPLATPATVKFTVSETPANGYTPYAYAWSVSLNAAPAVTISKTSASITYSISQLNTLLGVTLVPTDVLVISSVVSDSKNPVPTVLTAKTATLTVV